ncbi:hypothetical protein GCM10011391_33200 [Pullulanibacillus camelliae]|uniref:Major facilitator superfamily (MFS) profile domain-containing protein n=1 Tax=Pullulanibacillus camelliae TaxID=1707096 RepID=A0A8J3DXK3_9BACL|nr:hypothetical protein GCM10011391_33200 [Pullulanibacillus camelliae]
MVYSLGMGIGASLSAGLMIPLQERLNGSWQLALASWGIFAIIGLLFWLPMVKKSEPVHPSNHRSEPYPSKMGKHGCLCSSLAYSRVFFIVLALG